MKLLILLSAVTLASCGLVKEQQAQSVARMAIGNFVDCMSSDLSLCLKEKALKVSDRLRSLRQINIIDGVTIFNNNAKEAKSLDLSSEPETRKQEVTQKLWESTSDLLKNSDLELSWATSVDDEQESRALDNVEEGRGKKKEVKKKLKMLIPLLILLKIKAAALVVISLVIIAVSLAKIMLMAKIAFIAKAIALIKYLIHKKHSEEEHGWISHHEEPHGHGGWDQGWNSGWSRSSRNDANNLAYSAYSQ